MITVVSNNKNLDIVAGQDITFSLVSPLFETDRVPVAVSTGIEFAMTPENNITFGFIEAMMFTPKNQKIAATIKFAGVDIFIGELQFDEYSSGTLKYSFVEIETNDIIRGNIRDIKFPSYKDTQIEVFVTNARTGKYAEFGLPMIIRQANSAKFEYVTAAGDQECSIIDKYANHIYEEKPYIIPAIKVKYILQQVLSNIQFPADVKSYIEKLVVLGLYKSDSTSQTSRWGIPWYKKDFFDPNTGRYAKFFCDDFNFADSLPEITSIDFIQGLLKMFCATLFCNGDKYEFMTNKSIVTNNSFENWTSKVSAIYSIVAGEESGYTLSYANKSEPYHAEREDDLGQKINEIVTVDNYNQMLDKFKLSTEYKVIRISATNNLYSGRAVNARLYYKYPRPGVIQWNGATTNIPTIDIAYQAGLETKSINNDVEHGNSYDNDINFHCVRCAPASVATPIREGSSKAQVTMKAVAPIVEFPTIGAEIPTTVIIGLLLDNNCLDQGNYYKNQKPYSAPGTEQVNNLSIAIGGENGLFETFHREFANWYIKKKDIIKAEFILSPIDVANLQLWRKIMIHNRLYFIKNMEISIADSSDVIVATAEFIRV